ncbi:MAG: HEAT repeat domain-containing protein [Planctomycetes bacterium]|nr:HEAT repeat domain-containing protein [Planctomycetota bacterium]
MPARILHQLVDWPSRILWAIRSWPHGNEMLRWDRLRFLASGCRVEPFLSCPSWYLRNIGIKLIVQFQLEEYYPILALKLLDLREAPILRRNCAEGLGRLRQAGAEARSALWRALADPYWETRTEALRAITRTEKPSAEITAELAERFFMPFLDPGPCAGNPASVLAPSEGNFEVRATLASVLGKIGTGRKALSALHALARDENWIVRAQAALALRDLARREPDSREACRRVLDLIDPSSEGAIPHFILPEILRHVRTGLDDPARACLVPRAEVDSTMDLKLGWNKTALPPRLPF